MLRSQRILKPAQAEPETFASKLRAISILLIFRHRFDPILLHDVAQEDVYWPALQVYMVCLLNISTGYSGH
jgi:hypothetical protein